MNTLKPLSWWHSFSSFSGYLKTAAIKSWLPYVFRIQRLANSHPFELDIITWSIGYLLLSLKFQATYAVCMTFSCTHDISWSNEWNFTKLAGIPHWEKFYTWFYFGDLDLIFKDTGGLRWQFLVPTISHESVDGIAPNLHGYIIGTSIIGYLSIPVDGFSPNLHRYYISTGILFTGGDGKWTGGVGGGTSVFLWKTFLVYFSLFPIGWRTSKVFEHPKAFIMVAQFSTFSGYLKTASLGVLVISFYHPDSRRAMLSADSSSW